jgi:ribosome-binding protein aMBF1 (putative translation factor)
MSASKNRYNTTNSEAPDCQDWTPVTLSKKKPQKETTAKAAPSQVGSNVNSASAVVAATTSASKGNDDDAKKTKYIAKATSDAVRTSRCEKKLTQKELAQKCNMDVSIIAEIERGGCVYNATNVNKIQSVLGVKIPRA